MNAVDYHKGLVEIQLAEVKKWQGTDRADLLERALERLDEATKRHAAAVADARPKAYEGPCRRNYKTGTIHFVNGWGELFCGRDDDDTISTSDGFATCKTCTKAGNAAWNSDGVGGSPARRW